MTRVGSRLPRRRRGTWRGWPLRSPLRIGAGAAAGAGLMYLLDPNTGRRRRHIARDRALAAVRGAARRLRGYGRLIAAETYGLSQRVTHLHLTERPAPSDEALADRVRTEAFRDRGVPAGRVNVNVEGGVVVLRGQLDRPEQIRELEEAVRRVEGVHDVESHLHLPRTPAPNKQEALDAS